MQLWLRDESGKLNRIYAGEGPVYSPTLKGYFVAVDEGRKLRISNDEAGLQWWPTETEVERAAKEAERKAKEAAQKAEKEALALVEELKAQLAKATKRK